MIEDSQRQMRLALPIGLCKKIAAPDSIARDRSRHAVLQLFSGFENQIMMLLERAGDRAFPNRHLPLGFPSPIKMMRNRPAPRLGHQGFEPNHIVAYLAGFRLCVASLL